MVYLGPHIYSHHNSQSLIIILVHWTQLLEHYWSHVTNDMINYSYIWYHPSNYIHMKHKFLWINSCFYIVLGWIWTWIWRGLIASWICTSVLGHSATTARFRLKIWQTEKSKIFVVTLKFKFSSVCNQCVNFLFLLTWTGSNICECYKLQISYDK